MPFNGMPESHVPVHNDDQQNTAQVDTALWTPAAGKRFFITDLEISVDTAMTVTLKDEANVIKEFYLAANGGCIKKHDTPIRSAVIDNVLKYSTSVDGKISIMVDGYEET